MLALGRDGTDRREGDDGPRGQLRITSSYSPLPSPAGQVANDYLARYPGTAIDILLLDRTVNLVEERIDLPASPTIWIPIWWRAPGHPATPVVCASPRLPGSPCSPQQCRIWPLHNCLTLHLFRQEPVGVSGASWSRVGAGEQQPPSANISNLLLAATWMGRGSACKPRYSVETHLAKAAPWCPC